MLSEGDTFDQVIGLYGAPHRITSSIKRHERSHRLLRLASEVYVVQSLVDDKRVHVHVTTFLCEDCGCVFVDKHVM